MSNIFAEAAEMLASEGRSREEFDQLVAGEPAQLLSRALDPWDSSLTIIAWPGRPLRDDPIRGDLILRERPGLDPAVSVVAEPKLLGRGNAVRASWIDDLALPGKYVRTIEAGVSDLGAARRVAGPDGITLPGTIIIRAGPESLEGEGAARPTLRSGSSGPAVGELQSRLNAISLARLLTLQPPLPACPLDVDGKYGPLTRQAVIGFQRVAFPSSPSDWDGIVGPKTWQALDNASANVGPNPPQPQDVATVEFVVDDRGNHQVDQNSPVATALMIGLWDQAYDPVSGDVRNGQAETANFVGSDRRRFYIRVNDPHATGSTVTARWRTLGAGGGNDDAPASQDVTLTETSAGSKIYVSHALMLVSDETDAKQPTHSGLSSGPNAGVRSRGQSDHRLRRTDLDGSVRAEYTSAAGRVSNVTLPVFQRSPERRLRLTLRIVHMGINVTPAVQRQLDLQLLHANLRWAQAGLRIEGAAPISIPIPQAAQDSNGLYGGFLDTPGEAAVINALNVPDTDTVTVVFTRLPLGIRDDGLSAFNAYATITNSAQSPLGNRYFIFQHFLLNEHLETLAHELHHVLHNRFDSPSDNRFFTFNTHAPTGALPNVKTYRRIQTLHSADVDSDPGNDNTFNWLRRVRGARIPVPGGLGPATATTGNKLVRSF